VLLEDIGCAPQLALLRSLCTIILSDNSLKDINRSSLEAALRRMAVMQAANAWHTSRKLKSSPAEPQRDINLSTATDTWSGLIKTNGWKLNDVSSRLAGHIMLLRKQNGAWAHGTCFLAQPGKLLCSCRLEFPSRICHLMRGVYNPEEPQARCRPPHRVCGKQPMCDMYPMKAAPFPIPAAKRQSHNDTFWC
jgi:hypothetical protein